MSSTVMIDGQLVPPERAQVSVFDRGFLYGDSVFESLRSYHGAPFALDEHLVRLKRSAERVAIALPVGLDTLRNEMHHALRVHGSPDSYLRLTLTRGTGRALGLDPELAEEPLRVLLVTALAPPAAEMYEHGIAAVTHRAERSSDAAGVADAKIGNYLMAVLAMRAARALGAREALIEDRDGHVLEGAASNLFAVIAGKLVTAPESAAILPGITRGHVLELARAAGIAVELRALAKSELASAQEVFVCSSIRELVPVISIDGRLVGNGTPGPTSRELLRAYRRRATASAPPRPHQG
jgi:branched-chain amino acid aminotransferase